MTRCVHKIAPTNSKDSAKNFPSLVDSRVPCTTWVNGPLLSNGGLGPLTSPIEPEFVVESMSFEEACLMKTYPARLAATVTSRSCRRSWDRHSTVQASSRATRRTIGRQTIGRQSIGGQTIGGQSKVDVVFGEPAGLDNRQIATILRGALMDLVVAFQAIERQLHAAPDRSATSNRS